MNKTLTFETVSQNIRKSRKKRLKIIENNWPIYIEYLIIMIGVI